MRLERFENEKKPKIMIIPMIDIIFFLLVFFMMSMLSMVTIFVEKEPVSKAAFKHRMEIEMGRNHDVKVLLRADKNSQHGDFVFVLDQLKALGIHRISIATDSN